MQRIRTNTSKLLVSAHKLRCIPGIAALAIAMPSNAAHADPDPVRDGLPHAAAKLSAGEDFKIVFLGGSITKGDEKSGFSERVPEWLQISYPEARVAHKNAGINGTDSEFGAARTDRDVLAAKPDLVFVEFAVNDGDADRSKAMERIVRKIWTFGASTDIVFLYTLSEKQLGIYREGHLPPAVLAHEKVAEYYGIPSIVLGSGLLEALDSGTDWKVLMKDGCHPTPAGYERYIDQITTVLSAALSTGQTGRTLPTPLATDFELYPAPVAAKPMAAPVPLQTTNGRTALKTFDLPKAGEHWRTVPEFRVRGQQLWGVYYQSFNDHKNKIGGRLDASFSLSREPWKPMTWLEERGSFDGSEGMPLWSQSDFSARENNLPVITFVAPETGQYAFQLHSKAPLLVSHHNAIALNVVQFPWGKNEGRSLAFFSTSIEEKEPLRMDLETDLVAGEVVAFCLDTNVFYGGGLAAFPELTIQAGLLELK